jgi:hypothetical protein
MICMAASTVRVQVFHLRFGDLAHLGAVTEPATSRPGLIEPFGAVALAHWLQAAAFLRRTRPEPSSSRS